ncbi:hypothetical protein Snoj_34930 [Streptomyces nojiriensis]|uniref:Uncharacterized protein n=1 Tax=Streptomyces nojiriensis TaxID=66374 RepID=A0ABQ3SN60_9ACTN|nr:hypothetical protein GCM10010205_72490 [Streptomyces nojiriensis]GHI69575.1 hypothetical protein Snoj_34930 [Streptomyces nojiriensis]
MARITESARLNVKTAAINPIDQTMPGLYETEAIEYAENVSPKRAVAARAAAEDFLFSMTETHSSGVS